MADPYGTYSDNVSAPARNAYALVPHDSNQLTVIPKGIYVGTGGDITLRAIDAAVDVTYRNLPNASYIAVRAAYVRATGTTAANLIAEA